MNEKYVKLSDLYQIIEPELTFEMLDKINNVAFVINVESTPTTEAKWIVKPDFMMDVINQCSACGKEFILLDGTAAIGYYHFCPNCGATMVEYDK